MNETTILMCHPNHFGIHYSINPWMAIENQSNNNLAITQWEALFNKIIKCEATIETLDPVEGLPDLVFTANAGLTYNRKFIPANFKFKERQGETPIFSTWFQENDFDVIELNQNIIFEGAGDALFMGDELFLGYGFRTDLIASEALSDALNDEVDVIPLNLVNPRFYHLDTCFCPIDEETCIYYPNAFSSESNKKIESYVKNPIKVSDEDAYKFACNAVVIDDNIIIPSGCEDLKEQLESLNYKAHECDMSEFLKSGGACKCLTIKI